MVIIPNSNEQNKKNEQMFQQQAEKENYNDNSVLGCKSVAYIVN